MKLFTFLLYFELPEDVDIEELSFEEVMELWKAYRSSKGVPKSIPGFSAAGKDLLMESAYDTLLALGKEGKRSFWECCLSESDDEGNWALTLNLDEDFMFSIPSEVKKGEEIEARLQDQIEMHTKFLDKLIEALEKLKEE